MGNSGPPLGIRGNGAWVRVPNAQCPMPQVGGRLSLSTHKGMEFPADFQ
ncbi:hypothetical protein [Tolypothrix sp. PCC 7601]|nr:hypothetical protein [Tolypothrix sp. PCC 7601]UYD34486.1 hypothetical protein HG267_01095 [Tolypothrix sp. PCC 7601]